MGDLISIKKRAAFKRADNWRSLARSEIRHEDRITMTQEVVWDIFRRVVTADSLEEALRHVAASLPTRRHFTYWLGQIGHRLDVRLGRDRSFADYLGEVLARLREKSRHEGRESSLGLEGGTMKAKKSQSRRIEKVNADEHKMTDTSDNDFAVQEAGQVPDVSPVPATAVPDESKTSPQMGRIQQYWISTMLIFADCAVQKSPDGVFDVLARNFETTGALSWWLHRIGHAEIAKHTKGKDIVDAIRKVAHELYRELRYIGKPVAR